MATKTLAMFYCVFLSLSGCQGISGNVRAYEAIKNRDASELRRLIQEGEVDPDKPIVFTGNLMDFARTLKTRDVKPPIAYAAAQYDPRCVQVLIEAGANLDASTEAYGWTALNIAANSQSASQIEIVRLLASAGADLEARTYGRTPLLWAAGCGACPSLKALLENGADIQARTSNGATALKLAQRGWTVSDFERRAVEKAVRVSMAEASPDDATLLRGDTLIMRLARGDADALVRQLDLNPDGVNDQDLDGWTALMWAAGPFGSVRAVDILLQAGADPNAASTDGWTALMSAEDEVRLKMLLDAGADPNTAEKADSFTPLMIAAYRGTLEQVKLLLQAGADARAKDRLGRGCVQNTAWSKRPQRDEIISLLEDAISESDAKEPATDP